MFLGFGCKNYEPNKGPERYQKYAWNGWKNHENGHPVVDQQPQPSGLPEVSKTNVYVDPLVELSKFYPGLRSDYRDGFRDFEGRRLSYMDALHVAIQRIVNFTANLDDRYHFTLPKVYLGGNGDQMEINNRATKVGIKFESRNHLLKVPQVLIFCKKNGLIGENRFQAFFEVENLTKNEIRFGITSDLYETLNLYTFKPSDRVTLQPGQKILMKIITKEWINPDLTYADLSQDTFKIAGVIHLTLEQIEKLKKLGISKPPMYNVADYSRVEFEQFMKSGDESKVPCQINHINKICNWTEVYANFEKDDDGVPIILLKPDYDLVNDENFDPMEYLRDELLANEGLNHVNQEIDKVEVGDHVGIGIGGDKPEIKNQSIMKDLVVLGIIYLGALVVKYLPVSFYVMTKVINDAAFEKND